ncbi:MAG: hypothetical protein QM372_01315 [Bacillota bacterium]|jgi:hypothetical protein|nr:hypothetical protein [Bacillota bacterium]
MRRRTLCLAALLLALVFSSAVSAMDFDFDDLFSDDLFVEVEATQSDVPPEEALLRQDGLDVGGNYRFAVHAGRSSFEGLDPVDTWQTSLGGQLYLDARPDPNFRVFGKVGLSYAVGKRTGEAKTVQDPVKFSLQEFFSDFNYDSKVFFRAGKQNVKWGVGYFFSPADVISIGRINPLEPEAEREGPVALKAHYPKGSTNYYLYTLFDGADAVDKVALAPKMEFVVGGTEIGLGGFYQKDKAPRGMITVSSSLGSLALFGEAVISKGADKAFVEGLPMSYPLYKDDQVFFHATAGARYSRSDPDGLFNFTAALQYYFNGEGYRNQDDIQNFRKYYAMLLAMSASEDEGQRKMAEQELEKINVRDMSSTGRHYLAAMAAWNNLLNTKFSATAFLNANLSDQSGMVTATLSLPSLSKISPSVGMSFNYGEPATEFGGAGRNTTVFAAVSVSGAF